MKYKIIFFLLFLSDSVFYTSSASVDHSKINGSDSTFRGENFRLAAVFSDHMVLLPAAHEVMGAEVVVSFAHAEGGLRAKGGEFKGFLITGEDRRWKPAVARIDGVKVILSSPKIEKPVAVRYSWARNPEGNLINGAGLPASPFRTDNW